MEDIENLMTKEKRRTIDLLKDLNWEYNAIKCEIVNSIKKIFNIYKKNKNNNVTGQIIYFMDNLWLMNKNDFIKFMENMNYESDEYVLTFLIT